MEVLAHVEARIQYQFRTHAPFEHFYVHGITKGYRKRTLADCSASLTRKRVI